MNILLQPKSFPLTGNLTLVFSENQNTCCASTASEDSQQTSTSRTASTILEISKITDWFCPNFRLKLIWQYTARINGFYCSGKSKDSVVLVTSETSHMKLSSSFRRCKLKITPFKQHNITWGHYLEIRKMLAARQNISWALEISSVD